MRQTLPHIPPEWAPVSTLWVGWPHLQDEWGEDFSDACNEISGLIRLAEQHVSVVVACGTDESLTHFQDYAQRLGLGSKPKRAPLGDIWLRDTGPVVGTGTDGLVANCFRFNGWGGKYVLDGDTETAEAIASNESLAIRFHDFILEGGSVEMDGEGHLLTTRECLLNSNRNADWSEVQAVSALTTALGVSSVTWLDRGLRNDHTDGHVDNLARFVGPRHVVCQAPADGDPNAERLREIELELRKAGFEVATIPSPGLVTDGDGYPAPASHMNFVFINDLVVVPVYNQTGDAAVAALQAILPDHTVRGLPSRAILTGGGSFHCMSCHIPQFGGSTTGIPT